MGKIKVDVRDLKFISFPKGIKLEVFISIPKGYTMKSFLTYKEIEEKLEGILNNQ